MNEVTDSGSVVSAEQRAKGRRQLLLVAAVFVLPILLAWLVLKFQWFETGVMSHGEWVDPPMQLDGYPSGKWGLAKIEPRLCSESCLEQRELLQQVWLSLGAARQQTGLWVIADSEPANLPEGAQWLASSPVPAEFAGSEPSWLVIDPKGWVILSYQPELGHEHLKGLVADVKKLVKLSRFK
ncbi:hypothetical protein [Aliagarivorans taiwanensis]|uniref:hypothetical protein n=1 Tax=Aliagarivorans taiwanensis TaxID=561966 RepID=UPI0004090D5E|nr:hypothetical protein [Aliagarivorans taiwanensis]